MEHLGYFRHPVVQVLVEIDRRISDLPILPFEGTSRNGKWLSMMEVYIVGSLLWADGIGLVNVGSRLFRRFGCALAALTVLTC